VLILEAMNQIDLSSKRSACPIAAGLDIMGDRWSLLVVRDMLLSNKHRYGEFLAMPERITTSVLADRLKRLEAFGIIKKRLHQEHPPRYEYSLTERGRELEPLVKEVITWGLRHVAGTGK